MKLRELLKNNRIDQSASIRLIKEDISLTVIVESLNDAILDLRVANHTLKSQGLNLVPQITLMSNSHTTNYFGEEISENINLGYQFMIARCWIPNGLQLGICDYRKTPLSTGDVVRLKKGAPQFAYVGINKDNEPVLYSTCENNCTCWSLDETIVSKYEITKYC